MKYIFKCFNFGIITYRDAETLLNNMAARGYEFKGTGKGHRRGYAMFEKNDRARAFKYTVDVRCGLEEAGETARELFSFYKDMGWEHVDSYGKKLHIFISKTGKATPLYTDEISKYDNFNEAMRQDGEIFGAMFLALLFGVMAWIALNEFSTRTSHLVGYGIFVFCAMWALIEISIALDYCIYRVRCKNAVGEGRLIPENLVRREISKWSNIISILAFVMAPIAEIYGCIYLIFQGGMYQMWGIGVTEKYVLIGLMCWSILSVPVVLASHYMGYRFPQNDKWRMASYIFTFFYYLNIFGFFNVYSRVFLNFL